jgi:hypothetical protein
MMSNALGISAVTAALEILLNDVYTGPGAALGIVTMSATAPDIVQSNLGTGSNAALQVNLFMHQVTLNGAWRNIDLPSLDADGTTRLQNPPLALDLHYLLTAYGSDDFAAEALLGFAVQFLHDTPVLSRAQIADALSRVPASNHLSAVLGLSGIAEQIEMIKLTPATLGREELAWLWTALKADYRPTFPFQASVVLIKSQAPAQSGPPVLRRTVGAQPSLVPPFPALTAVEPPNGQPAASLGDVVTVRGANLAQASGIVLANARLGINQSLTSLSNVGNTSFQFTLPAPPPDLPAGLYLLSAQVTQGPDVIATNGVPLAIAPTIGALSPPGPYTAGPRAITVPCSPAIHFGQDASLLIGGQAAPVDPFATAVIKTTSNPSFTFADLRPTGQPVPVWLRVDGIDSPTIDMTQSQPVFSGPFVQVT